MATPSASPIPDDRPPDLARQRRRADREIATSLRALARQRGTGRFALLLQLGGHYERRANLADLEDDDDREAFRARALACYAEAAAPGFAGEADYPEALYLYATTLLRRDPRAGMEILRELFKSYPTHRRMPDVYLALADSYFDATQIDTAGKLYERVLAFPDTPLQGYARYKLAWVHINLGDHARALEDLVRVVELGAARPADAALARAAKRDLVYCFAQVGRPDKAQPFFRRIDAGAAEDMVDRLGEIYRAQGKLPEQIALRRGQLRDQPTSPRRCAWQLEIVDATLVVAGRAEATAELARLSAIRAEPAATPVGAAEQSACDSATGERIGTTARQWHRESQATLDPETAADAAALYERYLDDFGTRAEAIVTRYYLGDLLWQRAASERRPAAALAEWQRTAAVFARSATTAPPANPILEDAIAAAVAGYGNAIAIADALTRPVPELHAEAAAFLDWVGEHHPNSPSAAAAADLRSALRTR